MLLAKPKDDAVTGKPISIKMHTRHVRDEATRLLDARPFVSQKYLKLTGKDLRTSVDFCARWHDAGKEHPKWQAACRADYELFKTNPKARGENLMKSYIRHEMDSLRRLKESGEKYTKSDLVAIAAHHSKLSHRAAKRWNKDDGKRFAQLWTTFLGWSENEFRLNDPKSFEAAVLKRYLYDGPRAMLQLADGRASAREAGEALPTNDFRKFPYKFNHFDEKTGKPSYRGVQQIIRELWDEPLAILRAPTGAGKTDAAYLWAQHQIEQGRADRMIIAMPTRFTSNALAKSTKTEEMDVGVYHSTSLFNRKSGEKKSDETEEQTKARENWIRKENELARKIETPVTVTTLDHLCIALTGAREDHHAIFWGMAHSCVVIDEADFYDEFTQYNLVTLLRALRVLQVPVLVMSATVPKSSRELYASSGTEIKKIHEDKSDLTRTRCRVHVHRLPKEPDESPVLLESEEPKDIADLLQAALDGKPTIIYANTVKRAQSYCKWFENKGFKAKDDKDEDDGHDPKKVFVLYHSRFTEPDKKKKEGQLEAMLGKNVWGKDKIGEPYGVAILTQIGELSVNISADYMISDFCPIDRLAQRAGRLSRFGEQVGELHVVTPLKTDRAKQQNWYPAPYGSYEGKEGWVATQPLLRSKEWLENGEMSAQKWIDGVNTVYPTFNVPQHRTIENRKKLEKSLVLNWMIVQAAEIGEDDDGTKDWKSRDIPPQTKIYVCPDNPAMMTDNSEPPFRNMQRFREWETATTISIMSHEVKLAIKNGTIEELTTYIGEDEVKIFIAKPDAYSFAKGLQLTPEADEIQEGYNPHDED